MRNAAPEKKLTVEPIVKFMRDHGWHTECLEVGVTMGGRRFGTPGRPDWIFIKPLDKNGPCVMIWCEAKAPGARMQCRCRPEEMVPNAKGRLVKRKAHTCTMCAQAEFRRAMVAKGFVVVQFDNADAYKRWFLESFGWTIQDSLPLLAE